MNPIKYKTPKRSLARKSGGVTILELNSRSCRYMTGQHLYCGDDIIKGSYCATHYNLCHKKRISSDKLVNEALPIKRK